MVGGRWAAVAPFWRERVLFDVNKNMMPAGCVSRKLIYERAWRTRAFTLWACMMRGSPNFPVISELLLPQGLFYQKTVTRSNYLNFYATSGPFANARQ